MNLRAFLTVFGTVFLAELGDKTQLATFSFAAGSRVSRWTIFAGAALALVTTSALGVAAGDLLARRVNPRVIAIASGALFVVIGAVTIWRAARGEG